MLMYKNQEQNKLNQRQALVHRQMLRTKTDTKTRTELKQKRKLIIYTKDEKYYIDHFAAYALKLTSARAVMTNTPHLIEIRPEAVSKLRNDETIEIEFHEIDKNIDLDNNENDLSRELSELDQGEYGIGTHGIDVIDSEEKARKAESIINNGLTLNNNSKTALSTSVSFGLNDDSQRISQSIEDYKYGAGEKGTIVIAVPLYIQNKNGDKIFLGFPEENTKTSAQQYDEHCILDRICSKLRRIPPQFILGYYHEDQYGNQTFTRNEHHYSKLNEAEKEQLFNECMSNMDDISINFNNLIANRSFDQLDQIKKRMETLGWKSHMADTSILLARKYQNQDKKEETPKSNRVILSNSIDRKNEIAKLQEMRNRIIMLKTNAEEEIKQGHNSR